jgi:hypothetical protein
LIEIGTPRNGGRSSSPATSRASASRAAPRAWSAAMVRNASSCGFSASMRARVCSTSGRVLEIGFGIGLNLQFEEAGFAIDAIDNFYMERMPRIGGYLYVGVATEVFGL